MRKRERIVYVQTFTFAEIMAVMDLTKIEKRYYGILTVFVFLYLILRSIYVPFVYDEAATFFIYIRLNEWLPWHSYWDANNHLLNSALGVICYQLFGKSEFVLRLPSLLSFLFYSIAVIGISRFFSRAALRYGFVTVMLTMPGLLEFFALARGYGLSISFLTLSVWFALKYVRDDGTGKAFAAIWLMIAAIASNMSLLNSGILTLGLISIVWWLRNDFQKIGLYLLLIVPVIGMLLFFAAYSMALKERGLLYYGSQTELWSVTFKSFSLMMAGSDMIWMRISLALAFFVAFFWGLYTVLKSFLRLEFVSTLNYVYLLFAGNVMAIAVMNLFLKVNLPEDRTGIYLFPLLVILMFFLVNEISSTVKEVSKHDLILVPILAMVLPLLWMVNFSYTSVYKDNYFPKRFVDKIYSEWKVNGDEYPPLVGGTKGRDYPLAWESYVRDERVTRIEKDGFPNQFCDFIMVEREFYDKFTNHYELLDSTSVTGYRLMKRKQFLTREHIGSVNCEESSGPDRTEYYNFEDFLVDSLEGNALELRWEVRVVVPADGWGGRLVYELKDRRDSVIDYQSIQLERLSHIYRNGIPLRVSMLIPKLTSRTYKLHCFFWNTDTIPLHLRSGKVDIMRLVERSR